MEIKVLGTGCSKCKKLMENVTKAVENASLQAEIEKVEDIQEIMAYGVMKTPALVVDGQVKVMGRVPNPQELEQYLS